MTRSYERCRQSCAPWAWSCCMTQEVRSGGVSPNPQLNSSGTWCASVAAASSMKGWLGDPARVVSPARASVACTRATSITRPRKSLSQKGRALIIITPALNACCAGRLKPHSLDRISCAFT
eukprot:1185466-Pleurochrysis_carterae.AAC.3